MFDLQHPPPCPACGDERPEYMGPLGRLHWYRCRACGTAFNLESLNQTEKENNE